MMWRLSSGLRAAATRPVARLIAGGSAVAGGIALTWTSPADAAAAPGRLVMSGDCGGTNTRLALFRIPDGVIAETGKMPVGVEVHAQHYVNSKNESFTACCKQFLAECDKKTGGQRPQVCCLACAGGIKDNSVSFTNIKDGWTIEGNSLAKELGIPKVKLINDFEAQGYGLLTLSPQEKIKLNSAEPQPGAPIACVGAGTGLGECYLTAGHDGKYTCWPSEGGHAEASPRSAITSQIIDHLRAKLVFDTAGSPERLKEYFDQFDSDKDGVMNCKEFETMLRTVDLKSMQPRRVSVERIVSGPGLAAIYGFLRAHWAFHDDICPQYDGVYLTSEEDVRGRIVAECAASGNKVCRKSVEIFSECYGSEVGVAALKFLPYGGLYVSGGIAAKNPDWIKSKAFMDAYADKGRMSILVMNVPLYLVTTEDTGERGALFYAVSMLES